MAGEIRRDALERDLLWAVLQLGESTEPRAGLSQMLALLVRITGAARGYLELHDEDARGAPRWTISEKCSEEEEQEIRAVTSRGIVAAALASRTTVHSPYALLDDRFSAQPSVQAQRIEAVLCVPLGDPGQGALYLEGRRGAGPFSAADVDLAEKVGRHLAPALERAARAEDRQLREDPTRPFRARMKLDGIIGRGAALARVFSEIEPYAALNVTLLIEGDTGTGKTQIARAIHDSSPRRHGPFVELNCGAIPETLMEAELFGTMPGAFTGARRVKGKVEAAEGGTLFLDEIAEIPLGAQAKLLQFLESKEYYALASDQHRTANVRLLAATHQDLGELVESKRFRKDLFHRINVVRFRMPSLDERREDIPLLADSLVERLAATHGIARLPISERLRLRLQAHAWEGNVRELHHQLEASLLRAVSEQAPQIEIRHLPGMGAGASSEAPPTFHEATRLYQRDLLKRELSACGWNVIAAAQRLDLTRSHVYNLINQFDLKPATK